MNITQSAELSDNKSDENLNDISLASDGLYKSAQAVQIAAKENTKRIKNAERYTKVFGIYMKCFFGRKLSDEEDDFLLSYLNQSSIKATKKQSNHYEFVNEFDYSMGDIVIAFPNPDHKDIEEIDDISPLEAIELCMSCFFSKSGGSDWEMMDNLISMKAFEQAYFLLKKIDYHKREDIQEQEDIEVVEIEEISELSESQKLSSRKDSAHSVLKSQRDSQHSVLKSNRSDSIIQDDQNSQQKRLHTPAGGGRLMRYGGNDQLTLLITQIEEKLMEARKVEKALRNAAYKEVFNLDYHKLKEKAKFLMSGGKYLKFYKHQKVWKRTTNDTQDFATLIRNLVLLQVIKLGFMSRQFISTDGKIIFCVLYQNDDNLKSVAQSSGITKQLNFQFSDLLSLEPVDKNLRPLRMNNRLWRPSDYADNQISEVLAYLRPKIKHLLKEIKFKNIARETNLSQLNQQIFSEGATDILQDENGPTDDEWQAFYSYLLFLSDEVKEIRQSFHIDNDLALMINGQKRPYELYMSRFPEQEKYKELITNLDLEILYTINQEAEIEQKINFEGRHPELINIYKGIFQEFKEWKAVQLKFAQIKTFLHISAQKPVNSKQIKVCYREKLAFNYYQLLKDALKITNFSKKKILFTMWDVMDIDPFEPYIPYNITPKMQAFSQKAKMNSIWKKYCITETGKTSIFSGMERLKINSIALNQKINFSILLSHNLSYAVFCLNDNYELHGKPTIQLYNQLFDKKLDPKRFLNISQNPYFYKQYVHNLKIGHQGPNQYINSEYEYVKEKPKDLAFRWRFQKLNPWNVPTESIREYYGEKIALYFTFLGYYTKMLLPIGIIGLGVNLFQLFVWDNYSANYVIPSMAFGFIQVQWCNMMFELWQQREKIFAVRFGQQGGAGNDQGQERSDFKGEYQRSVENDNLNNLTYSDFWKFIKILSTMGIQFLILGVYAGLLIGIFFITEKLSDTDSLQGINDSIIQLDVTLPAIINLIILLILDEFYDKTAEQLTDYENHKTIQEYETNFVFKKYFLSFISLCGPILEIMFNHERVGLKCSRNDCFRHAQYYFSSIFIFQFTLNIWEIVKPKLLIFYRNYQAKKELLENLKSEEGSQQNQNEEEALNSADLQVLSNEKDPFETINLYIQNEYFNKESYVISPERYGTVDDYMEITLQYSMLALFGTSFPFCFTIAFIWNVLELQTDKLKLLQLMQRPLPLGEASIGVWNGVLEGLAYLSLVTNSGLISYQRERIDAYNPYISTLFFFLLILLFNFFLRFVENGIFGDISFEVKELMRRHQYLIKSTVDKFRGSSEKTAGTTDVKSKLKRYPIHKVYGCKFIQSEDKQYDELSSDSEIEDYIIHKPKVNNKNKQSTNKQKLTVPILQKFFQQRLSNWAMKFKVAESEDPEIRLKQKAFFLTTLSYLKQIAQMNAHVLLWTDDRFTMRYFHLRRTLVLLRNLDWRRMIIYKENQKALKISLKEQQIKKYEQQLEVLEKNIENEQNQVEKAEIKKKMKKHVEKHRWVDSRKTIVFKLQGVWFGQFRKRSKKVASYKILNAYHRILKKYKKLVHSHSTKTSMNPIDEQFISKIFALSDTQLLNFSKTSFIFLIDRIEFNKREDYLYNLTSKGVSLQNKELDAYIPIELRKQFNILNFSYVPFRIQAPFVNQAANTVWQLFVEEQISETQPELYIMYPLDKKKELQSSSLEFNVFGIRPYLQRWLCSQIKSPEIQNILIYFHTEIGFHRVLHRDIINRVLRFHNLFFDSRYNSIDLHMPFATLKYIHIQQATPLLNLRDPLVKGYFSRAYAAPKNTNFCNGKTLRDVLKNKKTFYEDNAICDFIGSTITTLEFLETEFGMYHGSLNLNAFMLIERLKHFQYCLMDVGVFYWYDFKNEQTYFTRALECNDELWYLSPELMYNYLNPTKQMSICPQKCDMYSLGIVSLQLLTLGKMSEQIEMSLKEYEGDVDRAVKRWIVNNRQSLAIKYPNSMQLILQLIHPDQRQRLLPSTMLSKVPNKVIFRETDIKINFQNILEQINNSIIEPKITQERMVRIFDGKPSQLNTQVQEKILLIEYLKQQTFKLQLYLRMQQFKICEQEMAQFEENLLKQYFFQLPYAKQTGDVLWCIENYAINQIYDIIEGNLNEFKYIVHYMLLKAQLCTYKQDQKQANSITIKGMEIIKGIQSQLDQVIKEVIKKEEEDIQNESQTIQLGVMNQQQLGELQFQKDTLIKRLKIDNNLYKLVKKEPIKLKQYSRFFNQLLMQINYLQLTFETAVEIGEEMIIELQHDIKQDIKRIRKKTFDGKHIIKENICIKIVQQLILNYFRLIGTFDSCRENEFQFGIHELINDLMVMNSYLINEENNLDPSNKSQIKMYFQGKVLKLREDFRKSAEQTLQYYYLQAKFIQVQQLHRTKDCLEIKKRLKYFNKHLIVEPCLFELNNRINQLGWTGELYAEMNDEEKTQLVCQTIIDIMDEYFFMIESFVNNVDFYINYPNVILSNLIYFCSQNLVMNPINQTIGIYQGFYQLLSLNKILEQNIELNAVLSIKVLHIIIHNQADQQPYYHKQSAEQKNIYSNLHPEIFQYSLINKLNENYETILSSLYEEVNGKLLPGWFRHQSMNALHIELIYGFQFSTSNHNFENCENGEFLFENQQVDKSMDLKIYQVYSLSNKNEFVKLEYNLARAKALLLQFSFTNIPKLINSIMESIEAISIDYIIQSETKNLIQLALLSLLDIILNYAHFTQIKYKNIVDSDEFKWIQNHKYYDFKLFVIKIIDFYFKTQEIEMATELIKFSLLLFDKRAKLFSKTSKSFYLTLQILRVKAFQYTEDLRVNVDKYDKNDGSQIEDLFEQVIQAYALIKKNSEFFPIAKLLLSKSLEQNEMNEIKEFISQAEVSKLSLANQLMLCQLGVKLIIYQIHTGQFKEADNTAYNIDNMLFGLIYEKISSATLQWQSEKIFQKNTLQEISVNQLYRILRLQQQGFEKYEHNVLIQFEPLKELFINVRQFKNLKQLISFRALYSYLQCLHTLAQIMKGDFRTAQQNLPYIEKFQEIKLDEVQILVNNIMMMFEIGCGEFLKGQKLTKLLLKQIQNKQITMYIQIQVTENKQQYNNLIFENIVQIDEDLAITPINISFESNLIIETLKPYLDITKLNTEAYLSYLEAAINLEDQLTLAVEQVFETQKYVQQYFGNIHMFTAHILRLIATMYSEFLINNRLKDLEKELSKNAEEKIDIFYKDLQKKNIKYLEARVKNQCTSQMENKFKETVIFINAQIAVLKDIKNGISQEIVCRWSLNSANESYTIYQYFAEEYQYQYNPYLGYLFITYSDVYFIQNKIVSIIQNLNKVKDVFEYCYTSISNPDYCRLYYKQGCFRQNIQLMQKIYIEALIGLKSLDQSSKYYVLIAILQENAQYLIHFDSFKSHGFNIFLERNIANQIKQDLLDGKKQPELIRKDEQDLQALLAVESNNIQFQKSVDPKAKVPAHIIDTVLGQGVALLGRQKIKFDYSGQDLFEKAYSICKLLFKPDNPLYMKLEDQITKTKGRGRKK